MTYCLLCIYSPKQR